MTDGAAELLGIDAVPRGADPALVAAVRSIVWDDAADVDDAADWTDDGDAWIAALAEVLPDALRRHGSLGIPPEVTRETLRDVGRKHARYGAAAVAPWLLMLLRGDVLDLGRLQVARRPDADGHALHIPEKGALDPVAVDLSLVRIREVTGEAPLTCRSWLLDPELGAEIPDGNIAAFARRFEVEPPMESAEASAAVARFVFGLTPEQLRVPGLVEARTRVENLVLRRLRGGRDWSEPLGRLRR